MIDCQGGKITLAGRVIHDNQGEHYGVIPVHQALEESSDVAAIKLALKVGPDKFYEYIRDFGFGARTGVELPGETRGLLRPSSAGAPPPSAPSPSARKSRVTPLQLVSMVSTIANGGVYLPPHVLMPDSQLNATANDQKAAPTAGCEPFKPGEDLPNPLPPGAHRVISTLAAAQMRKMMEGVVLFGTGKPAQLNGYSSGGKTGTAQKVDPATHLYSKTMHIASFAGIAPVNNPVIAVAVVIDNPKGGDVLLRHRRLRACLRRSGAAGSRIPRRPARHRCATTARAREEGEGLALAEDDSDADQNNVNALFAAVNDLPPDDPLRAAPVQTQHAAQAASSAETQTKPSSVAATAPAIPTQAANQAAPAPQISTSRVTLSDGKKLTVPSLIGLPVRKVIEMAAAAGLDVQVTGSGTVREQAPAPGTQVPPGTKIVVRCQR